MHTRHPLRAALVAAIVPLVAIAAFGNSWFTEEVRITGDHGPVATRLLNTIAPFAWTLTPRRGSGSGTIWFAQALAAVVVVAGVLLVTWAVARHATGFSLFLGAWGTTVLVSMVGAFVFSFVSYGAIFRNSNPDQLGRFWHSVYQSPNAALWGAGVGLLVGAFAAALVGGVDTRPSYVTSAPLPGAASVWQPGPPPPTQQVPVAPAAPAAPSSWSRQTYVATPVVTASPVAAEPLAAPPAPPAPPPSAPAGDPTVVMIHPGDQQPPKAPPTDEH